MSPDDNPDPFENFAEGNGTLIDVPALCRVGQELSWFIRSPGCVSKWKRHVLSCQKCQAAIKAEMGLKSQGHPTQLDWAWDELAL